MTDAPTEPADPGSLELDANLVLAAGAKEQAFPHPRRAELAVEPPQRRAELVRTAEGPGRRARRVETRARCSST